MTTEGPRTHRFARFGVVAFCLASACIIPDRGIEIVSDENAGAVRIVERVPLPAEMLDVCAARDPKDVDDDRQTFCHQVQATRPSGLLRNEGPEYRPFCVCPSPAPGERGRDLNAIAPFEIHAEDADLDGDDPRDTLYGVLLLDPIPGSDSPWRFVEYTNYLAAGEPGVPFDPTEDTGDSATVAPHAREPIQHWRFRIGDGTDTVDLCNNTRDGTPLTPGIHNLRFMVSDRPFFRPIQRDADGAPVLDENGNPVVLPPHYVPDLAAGATYAVIDYVFECLSAADTPACNCEGVP